MKIRITYTIQARSGILIGSTSEALSIGIDRTTVRRKRFGSESQADWNQEPIIPGSSMKGKVRSECERILKSLGQSICRAPSPETMCPHGRRDGEPPLCPICQIFGGPTEKSRLFFSDAIAKLDGSLAEITTRVQAGVTISRKRRTAEDERLFYIDRGIEGLGYDGRIDGYLEEGPGKRQVALLIAGIESLVAIGGGKSRGLGWADVKIRSVGFAERELTGDEIRPVREELRAWHESR
jgi:CRISPR/Cas system CSM-associated protein Csm3 (group 7 of RAMP superfamily)